jgi:type VI secretion system protein ImpE
MRAQELFQRGELDECLKALQAQVRDAPADPAPRLFLLQLMALGGDWARAANQAKVLADLDPSRAEVYAMLASAIAGEIERAAVLRGEREPACPDGGPLPEWARTIHEGWRRLTANDAAGAAGKWCDGVDAAPPAIAAVNDQPPGEVVDADGRFGPVLECFVAGHYCWVPLAAIRMLSASPPRQLHETIWQPAAILLAGGARVQTLVPTRYPGSHSSLDPFVRRGHQTAFHEIGGVTVGVGQRVLACGDGAGDVAILDVRTLATAAGAAGAAGPGDDAAIAGAASAPATPSATTSGE